MHEGFYRYDQPATAAHGFFGREILIRSLLDGLRQGRYFALCGGPKSGRTSLLLQLMRHEALRWEREPQASKVVPVLVDGALLGARDPRQFISALWQALNEAIAHPLVAGSDPRPPTERFDLRRAPKPWAYLQQRCENLWEAMRGRSGWCQYALLIDNADALCRPELEAAANALNEFIRHAHDAAPLGVVAAGGRALREQGFDSRAPLAFLRPMALGVLRESEAAALVRAGLPDIDDEWLRALLHAAGCHPYVLVRLLAEIETHGLEQGFDAIVDAATDDCLGFFAGLWDVFDHRRGVTYRGAYAAPEHALMQLVFDYSEGVSLKTAEAELGIKPLKEYAEFLTYTGVAEMVMKSGELLLRSRFDLWNVWYNERVMR